MISSYPQILIRMYAILHDDFKEQHTNKFNTQTNSTACLLLEWCVRKKSDEGKTRRKNEKPKKGGRGTGIDSHHSKQKCRRLQVRGAGIRKLLHYWKGDNFGIGKYAICKPRSRLKRTKQDDFVDFLFVCDNTWWWTSIKKIFCEYVLLLLLLCDDERWDPSSSC